MQLGQVLSVSLLTLLVHPKQHKGLPRSELSPQNDALRLLSHQDRFARSGQLPDAIGQNPRIQQTFPGRCVLTENARVELSARALAAALALRAFPGLAALEETAVRRLKGNPRREPKVEPSELPMANRCWI
jgi:hypothetical protein